MFIAESLNICDLVVAFDHIMEEIGIEKYLKLEPSYHFGQPGYNRVDMLKTIQYLSSALISHPIIFSSKE